MRPGHLAPAPVILEAVAVCDSLGPDELHLPEAAIVGRRLIDRLRLDRGPLERDEGEAYEIVAVGVRNHPVHRAGLEGRPARAAADQVVERLDIQGAALLRDGFDGGSIGMGGLFLGALGPTCVAAALFLL